MQFLHRHFHLEERARRLGCLDDNHVIVDKEDWGIASQPVKLSRRNLLALLHKLEMPNSARTIIKPDGVTLIVEPDIHYAGRQPGPMHPETEAFIRELEEALELVRLDPTH